MIIRRGVAGYRVSHIGWIASRAEPPEINGSEGGFIGLVIALGVVFIASCVTVFVLLRARRGGGTGRGHVSTFVDGEQSSFPRRRGLRGWFSRLGTNGRSRGWEQQIDDFDSESEDGIQLHDTRPSSNPKRHLRRDDSFTGSKDVDLPALPHHDRNAPLPNPSMSSISSVNLHAPGALPGSGPLSTSPEAEAGPSAARDHHSQPTGRKPTDGSDFSTFEGGTKFKEDL